MKYYLSDIIPKIKRLSKQLDEEALLLNHHWAAFDASLETKKTYLFREKGNMIISEKGIVIKGRWENLGNQTLLLEVNNEGLLFTTSFFDGNVLILNLHNTDSYAFFFNETKIGQTFKTLQAINQYLDNKYSSQTINTGNSSDFENLQYQESLPMRKYDLFLGSHYSILITFSNGAKGLIYTGEAKKRYYFLNSIYGPTYCDSKEECIKQMYHNLLK